MSDQYLAIRSLPFPVVASALGINLSKFKTRKSGSEHYGTCPIHSAKNNTTSFSYNSDGRYFCFSCSAKGKGAIDLTQAVKGIGFKAACELLEPLVGSVPITEPTKEKSPVVGDCGDSGELKPFLGKYEKFAVRSAWLEERIPDEAIRKLYGVFCYDNPQRKSAYSGRVMLPVKDVEGVLYGYLGRTISSSNSPSPQEDAGHQSPPKYLFPKDLPKSRFLFGADVLKGGKFGPAPLKRVYLVESPFCVMKFASLGLPAVSPFGWSVSEHQIENLATLCKGILYFPDRNKYLDSGCTVQALSHRVWVRCPPLPDGCGDPEELSLEQIQRL